MFRILGITAAAFILASCGDSRSAPEEAREAHTTRLEFYFDRAEHGWNTGFADYTSDTVTPDLLNHGFETLPEPLDHLSGLRVSGENRSASLFMYITRAFAGFVPNSRYELRMEIIFATNAPSGCLGPGASPGEGVTIKAGATTFEPAVLDNGAGEFYMNLDKGNQLSGGSDAIAIGDFANSKACEDQDYSYEAKTLRNEADSFFVETDSSGELWILFGTDSGFMGTTSIYFLGGEVVATEVL